MPWWRWNWDVWRVLCTSSLDVEKTCSRPSPSMWPAPVMYIGCQSSWYKQLWAWLWNTPTIKCKPRAWVQGPRLLVSTIFENTQPISYAQPPLGPYMERSQSTIASGYFASICQPREIMWLVHTYSSPLLIMSQASRTKQCRHIARKMPDSSKTTYVFLQTFTLAFHQQSTQLNSFPNGLTCQSSSGTWESGLHGLPNFHNHISCSIAETKVTNVCCFNLILEFVDLIIT